MERIVKNYLAAVLDSWDLNGLKVLIDQLTAISNILETRGKHLDCLMDSLNAPYVTKEKRYAILCEVAQSVSDLDQKTKNLLKLFVEHNRIAMIPLLVKKLSLEISKKKKVYSALLYTSRELDGRVLEHIKQNLSKRFDVELTLEEKRTEKDGIFLMIEDLGIEVSFSSEQFYRNLKDHILRAI